MNDYESYEPPGGWDGINEPGGKFVSPLVYRYARWAHDELARLREENAEFERVAHERNAEIARLRDALNAADNEKARLRQLITERSVGAS